MLLMCSNLIKKSNRFKSLTVGIFSALPLKNSKPKNGILHMDKSQTITLGVR